MRLCSMFVVVYSGWVGEFGNTWLAGVLGKIGRLYSGIHVLLTHLAVSHEHELIRLLINNTKP